MDGGDDPNSGGIATGHTDMRRGMNSLALLVQEWAHRCSKNDIRAALTDESCRSMLLVARVLIRKCPLSGNPRGVAHVQQLMQYLGCS